MTSDTFQRKLTAILSADVVGYSRLMGDDEEATVRTLNKYKQIIFDLIERHNGRLVDSPGDNVLAEFVSVVDAIRCGVQIQEDLEENNEGLPPNRKMEFRIGINVGDVIQDGERIYGDGVNVAARIESLADPGGICLSRTAYDQVKRKLKYEYEYLGEYEVKNIDEPVRVYRVQMEPEAETEIVRQKKASTLSDKPSVVVLPFINISGDPEQEYFSDGMTEELINALANVERLKVISRTSSFFFKGKDVDLRAVGERLNVGNVIEGSVRKAGNRLRITAQLIKVADDTHLWSETYNRELEDVFAIQEEISKAIVDSLKIRLFGKEKEPLVKTYTENTGAYESYIKGRYFYNSLMEGGLEKALKYYKQAITLDPGYAPTYGALAEYYFHLPFSEQKVSRDDAYVKAMEAISKALEIDNNLPEAHATLGLIKWEYEWDWKGAKKAFETAIRLNPGLPKPHYDYAIYLAFIGNSDRSLLEARKAVELDPLSGIANFSFGYCLYLSNRFDQALQELQQACEMAPTLVSALVILVHTHISMEMYEDAMNEINRGFRLFPKHPALLTQMGHIYAQKGEKGKTIEILDELLERSKNEYVTPVAIASLYADLGEVDRAYEYLEEAYQNRDIWFAHFTISYPRDPRFNAFYKKIGL